MGSINIPRFYIKLKNCPFWAILLLFFILISLGDFMLSGSWLIWTDLPVSNELQESNHYSVNEYCMNIFFAPFFETLMFQQGVTEILVLFCNRKHKGYKYHKYIILFSAFCFSIVHPGNIIFKIRIFYIGVCLTSCYLLFKKKYAAPFMGFLFTVFLHSLWNIFAML